MTTIPPVSPRVIEIGDVTTGIVIPEQDGTVRFFSAGREFDHFDRRSFRSVDLLMKAVRELLERKARARHSAEAQPERSLSAPTFRSDGREGSSSRTM